MSEAWYSELAQKYGSQYGVPPEILDAVRFQESNGQPPDVYGPDTKYGKARGIYQFIPGTAKEYGLMPNGQDLRVDPERSTEAAAKYLSKLNQMFKGDWSKALAGYNWGEGNVQKLGMTNMPKETRDYVANISKKVPHLMNTEIDPAANPKGYGLDARDLQVRQERFPSSPAAAAPTRNTDLLEEAARRSAEMRAATSSMLQAAVSTTSQANAEATVAITSRVAAENAAAAEKGRLELESAGARRVLAASFGVSNRDESSIIGQTAVRINQLQAERQPLADEIHKRMGVGFFDNPVEWFTNQLVLPGMVAKHNASVFEENKALDNLKARNVAAQESIQTDAATRATVSDESIRQKAAETAARAQEELAKLKISHAASGAQMQMHLSALAHQEVTEAATLTSAADRQLNRETQRLNNALLEESRRQQIRIRQTAEEALAEETKSYGDLTARSGARVSAASIKNFTGRTKELVESARASGRFGANMADALEFNAEIAQPGAVKDTGGALLAKSMEAMKIRYNAERLRVTQDMNFQGRNDKDKVSQEAASRIGTQLTRELTDVTDVPRSSPYRANLNKYAMQPETASTFTGQLIKQILAAAPDSNVLKDSALIEAAVEKVRTEKLPVDQVAKDLAAFYKWSLTDNAMNHGIDAMVLPRQNSYNLRIGRGGWFGATAKPIDAADPVKLQSALIRLIAHRTLESQDQELGIKF